VSADPTACMARRLSPRRAASVSRSLLLRRQCRFRHPVAASLFVGQVVPDRCPKLNCKLLDWITDLAASEQRRADPQH
jgi:hypothetical protein